MPTTYGVAGRAVPDSAHVPLPTAPRASRDEDGIVARLERARAWRSPIVLHNPDPFPAAAVAPVAAARPARRRTAPAAAAGARPSPTGGGKVLTAEEEAAAVLDFRTSAATVPDIAAAHGISVKRLRALARAAGQPSRTPGGRRRSSAYEHADEIVARYQARELSFTGAAAEYSVNKRVIRDILTAAGVELRDDRSDATRAAIPQILERFHAGETKQAIAAALGVSRASVDRYTAGVTRTTPVTLDGHRPDGGATGQGHAARLHASYADAGTTPREVRAWAAAAGVECPPRGTPPRTVLTAWLDAHPTHTPKASA